METGRIASPAKDIIEHYFKLQVGGKHVPAPYFINVGHARDLRVMVGKGTPEEMETETRIWAQLKGVDLEKMSIQELQDFMRVRSIGIDCSGFIYHVFDNWCKVTTGKSLKAFIVNPSQNLRSRFLQWLRPAENIGADILTNSQNTQKITLQDIRVGDLIRSRSNGKAHMQHVMLIESVERDSKGEPVAFEYVHSTWFYGNHNGVRRGRVEITDRKSWELKDQKWLEIDSDGTCHTLEGLKFEYEDNGLRRPNWLKHTK